jgi:hypothetical protein
MAVAPRHLFVGVALWLVSVVAPSAAQQTCLSGGQPFRPVDYQELTVTNTTAIALDTAKLPAATTNIAMALVSVEDATIRVRFNGLPTATSGHEVAAGTTTVLCGRLLIEGFRAIRTSSGAGNAVLRVTLFDTYY